MSPQDDRPNGGKRKPPKPDGRNARERARVAAARADRRRKRRKLAILVVAIVVVLAAAGVGIGYATNFGKPSASDSSHGRKGWGPVKVEKGKPITLGKKDAPVTLTTYEDFRCPHCQEMHKKLGSTISDLQEEGKVKVALNILPVIDQQDQQHGSARAGNAMACAAEEGFGQAYYKGLFDNAGKNWTNSQLLNLADKVGKPKKDFSSCVKDSKHQDWVQSVAQKAQDKNVTSTPTVFINGKKEKEAPEWSPQQLRDAVKKASK